jgi:hypothetical protein
LAKSFNPAIQTFNDTNEIMIAGGLMPRLQTEDVLISYDRLLKNRLSVGAQYGLSNLNAVIVRPMFSFSMGYTIVENEKIKLRTSTRINYIYSRILKSRIIINDPNDPRIESLTNGSQLTADFGLFFEFKKLSYGLGFQNAIQTPVYSKNLPTNGPSIRIVSSYLKYQYWLSDIISFNGSHFFVSDFNRFQNSYQFSILYRNLIEFGGSFNNQFFAPFVSMHFQDNFKVYGLYRYGGYRKGYTTTIEAGMSFGFN